MFVQGSSDAGLMVWKLMDEVNKTPEDFCDNSFCIEGLAINNLIFVDDIVEFSRTVYEADYNTDIRTIVCI